MSLSAVCRSVRFASRRSREVLISVRSMWPIPPIPANMTNWASSLNTSRCKWAAISFPKNSKVSVARNTNRPARISHRFCMCLARYSPRMRHCIETIMAGRALIDKNTNQNGWELIPPVFGHRASLVARYFFKSLAISANWASAAWRSSTISAAMTSGSGRLALSSRLSSLSQKMSRLSLSRLVSSS